MKDISKCKNCGAPLGDLKPNDRIITCEYCRSKFLIDKDLDEELKKKQEETIQRELKEKEKEVLYMIKAVQQRYSEPTNFINYEKEKERKRREALILKKREEKGIRLVFAWFTFFLGLGALGIPSFICKRPKLGFLSLLLLFMAIFTSSTICNICWIINCLLAIPLLSIVSYSKEEIK